MIRSSSDITTFFESHIKEIDLDNAGFSESFWYYKSHLLYSILVQDLLSAYKFANKWVELFFMSPDMIELHPVFFIRGHQHLFEILYLLKYMSKFKMALERFEATLAQTELSKESQYSTLYIYG